MNRPNAASFSLVYQEFDEVSAQHFWVRRYCSCMFGQWKISCVCETATEPDEGFFEGVLALAVAAVVL